MRIRWEDCGLRIYVDGNEMGAYSAVSLTWDENVETDEAKYQGASQPSLDASYRGGSGTIEFRLDHDYANPTRAYDVHVAGIKKRDNTGRIRIVATQRSVGGAGREANRFDNCIVNQASRGGENQPLSISWNFRFENRVPIS